MGRTPPQGDLRDHDHSRDGEGGDQLNPDAIGLTGDEPFDFGDVEVEFRPGVGASGALVFRDTANGEDRFFIEIGDVIRLANQSLRMPDDLPILFGSDGDVGVDYDSANDGLRWADVGTSDRMALDRTTGNLTIGGTITEGASL